MDPTTPTITMRTESDDDILSQYVVDRIYLLRQVIVPTRETVPDPGKVTISNTIWRTLIAMLDLICQRQVPNGLLPIVVGLVAPYARVNAIHEYSERIISLESNRIVRHGTYYVDHHIVNETMRDIAPDCGRLNHRRALIAMMSDSALMSVPLIADRVTKWMANDHVRGCEFGHTMKRCFICVGGGLTDSELDVILDALLGKGRDRILRCGSAHGLNPKYWVEVITCLRYNYTNDLRRMLAIFSRTVGWEDQPLAEVRRVVYNNSQYITPELRIILIHYGVIVG